MEELIKDMSIDEHIGQMLMVGFHGTTPSDEIIELIQKYHVGNIILFSRNIRDTQQVLKLTQTLQQIAKEAGHRYPLFIAIDQENGIVQRLGEAATIFPGNMALGAIGSEKIAYEVAYASGQELKALGINLNLAPVVDVNNNPANPVIGVRSFGEDPHLVARLGAAMVRGYRAAGLLCTLKHFPGHGDTATDSHLALPTLPYPLEHLDEIEFVPFSAGIAAGADCVMVGHMDFPASTDHPGMPTTISGPFVRGLLRGEFEFDGLILSDCLEMDGFTQIVPTERGAPMAMRAGIDIVLISHHYDKQVGAIKEVHTALKKFNLSDQTIHFGANRILEHKLRYLSWDKLPTADDLNIVGNRAHQQLSQRAYEASTTLVKNTDNLVPLRLEVDEHIAVISPPRDVMTKVEDRAYSDEMLLESLRRRHPYTDMLSLPPDATDDDYRDILQKATTFDLIVMATVNAHLDNKQAALMRQLLPLGRPVIGIAVRNPYDLTAFPELRTYLATYEYTQPAIDAAVSVLFGRTEARGNLPVSLPGLSE